MGETGGVCRAVPGTVQRGDTGVYGEGGEGGERGRKGSDVFAGHSQKLSNEEVQVCMLRGDGGWEEGRGGIRWTLFCWLSFSQAVVTKVTADYDRWALLKANEPLITQLQAHWKGALIRREFRCVCVYA